MTIAISLKVNDGLVLASDSATTLVDQSQGEVRVSNVYDHANKIFNIVKGLPIGAITWGSGSIGTSSISTLVKDLRAELSQPPGDGGGVDPGNYKILDIANRLRQFIYEDRYIPAFADWPEKPPLGFVLAGFSSDAPMAEEYSIVIQGGEVTGPTLLRPIQQSGLTWNGEPEAITRLILGFGTGLVQVLRDDLGLPEDKLQPSLNLLQQRLAFPLVQAAMPFQDAIDLAEFLVDLTIRFSRWRPGAPTVGGPIEIAGISKHEGFRWVQRKHYYTRELNPGGDAA
jgi:hypothetical protein